MLHPRFHVHAKPPAVLALVAALGGQLAAQSPTPLIPYSGVVMDAAGNPLSDPVTLTFAIYADQEGGTPEWDEVQAVQPDWTGRYAVYLGAYAAGGLPLDLFTSDSPRWLGVRVEGDIEQVLVTDSTDGPGTGDWTPATDTQRQAVDGPIGNALTTHDDVYVVNALGVGTANPLQQFVVSNNGALGFEVAPFVGTVVLQAFDRQVGGYGRLRLDTSPSGPTMLLDQRGNVGIGTITPTTRLHVAGTVNATAFVGDGAGLTNLKTRPDPPCFDPFNRYVDCRNGTVTDTVTGLIWLKDPTCLDGDGWAGDNRAAAALAEGACGLSDRSQPGDWRLPTKAEWEATVAEAVRRGCVGDDAPSWTDDEGARCYSDGTSSSSFAGIVPGGYTTSSAVETAPYLAWTATLLSGGVVPVPAKVFGATNAWPVRNGR